MVVPHRDPGVVLVRGEEIEIGAVGSEALAVVVQSSDDSFGLGNAADAPAITCASSCQPD